eukprot:augustus_masked-scaffold_2-processed-gene-5.57-mRNA-1 protein AED:0.08 eAED:0.08 QI:0/-1/0/1/-1/1/1/0/251
MVQELIPETQLKKKVTLEQLRAASEKRKEEQEAKKQEISKKAFKRAETYVKEYRSMEIENIRLKRVARKAGDIFVEPEAKVAIVVRIRGIIGLHPKVVKILRLLRLRQIHNAVFVKLNKASINMLRLIEPYIAYGYPNLKTVKQLVYKRGYASINTSKDPEYFKGHKDRVPITSNELIEKHLGKFDVVCVEDIVHEIFTCGPHFKECAHFLWPFKLNTPKGGYKKKLLHFNEGGDAGNRGEEINKFVQRMI